MASVNVGDITHAPGVLTLFPGGREHKLPRAKPTGCLPDEAASVYPLGLVFLAITVNPKAASRKVNEAVSLARNKQREAMRTVIGGGGPLVAIEALL